MREEGEKRDSVDQVDIYFVALESVLFESSAEVVVELETRHKNLVENCHEAKC